MQAGIRTVATLRGRWLAFGLVLLLGPGCSPLMVRLYGIHPEREATPARIDRLAKRMKITGHEDLMLSASYYDRLQEVYDTARRVTWKGLHQPLQLRYYGDQGRLEWVVPNCDVGGFPNLRWDRFGLPDTLIVHPFSRAYADSAWTLLDDLRYMAVRPTGDVPGYDVDAEGHLLVYWTYYLGRQSVRLSRHIRKWQQKDGRSIEVRFVNADSLMMALNRAKAAR